jgi:hypothetical protein
MGPTRTATHRGRRIEASFVSANLQGWQVAVSISTDDGRTTCIFPPETYRGLSVAALSLGIALAMRRIDDAYNERSICSSRREPLTEVAR